MTVGDPMADLAQDVKDTCACVFSMLTVNEYESDEERIAVAANEIKWLFHRTEAREVFSGLEGDRG